MSDLPAGGGLDPIRRQTEELLRAALDGNVAAVARIRAVSQRLVLDSPQLAVAREYGFASWASLKSEIQRREVLDSRDVTRLRALLAKHPELATERMRSWCDHPRGASPLGYVAMLRYDTSRGRWREIAGTAAMARALLEAGAPVEGDPADFETP